MTPENTQRLCQKFPKIFPKLDSNQSESVTFWFECGDGWYNIIDSLCGNIQNYIDWKSKEPKISEKEIESLQVVATQIKEKFGTLRFYADGGNDVTDALIGLAESFSSHTCEGCGNVGKTYNNGWVRTHCDNCETAYQEKRKGP